MIRKKSFTFDDPLFKAAPTLQQAMFPNMSSFNHKGGLLACFEALAFITKTHAKPSIDPFAGTVEDAVHKMADSTVFKIVQNFSMIRVQAKRGGPHLLDRIAAELSYSHVMLRC